MGSDYLFHSPQESPLYLLSFLIGSFLIGRPMIILSEITVLSNLRNLTGILELWNVEVDDQWSLNVKYVSSTHLVHSALCNHILLRVLWAIFVFKPSVTACTKICIFDFCSKFESVPWKSVSLKQLYLVEIDIFSNGANLKIVRFTGWPWRAKNKVRFSLAKYQLYYEHTFVEIGVLQIFFKHLFFGAIKIWAKILGYKLYRFRWILIWAL